MKRDKGKLVGKYSKKVVCKACLSRDFAIYRITDRPHFKCHNCGHTWTKGKDGAEYSVEVRKRKDHDNTGRV